MFDTAIFFAILSLIFGGLNEVVFKRYSGKARSRGMMISGIGVVWALLLWLDVGIRGDSIAVSASGMRYALIAGLMVAIANILFLESLRHMEVSLGSTVYRLNTIAVVVLSIVFLGEQISLMKMAGIVCGVLAVLLLYRHQQGIGNHIELRLGLLLVTLGALGRAIYGVVSKAGLSAGADQDLLLLVSAFCWIVSGLVYARFVEHRYSITREKIGYSILSGVLVYGIVRSLLTALETGEASVVITVANLSFLMALGVATLLKMETLNRRKCLAMILAVSAIGLLTRV
ncbi:MAG: DMT family transporter [Pseudomonadota bacterium]